MARKSTATAKATPKARGTAAQPKKRAPKDEAVAPVKVAPITKDKSPSPAKAPGRTPRALKAVATSLSSKETVSRMFLSAPQIPTTFVRKERPLVVRRKAEPPAAPGREVLTDADIEWVDAEIAIQEGSAPDADPESKKAFADLRDRAAYIHVTGAYPTHLRPETVRLLRQVTELSGKATSLDGQSGTVRVRDRFQDELDLESHPMVLEVRRYLDKGWQVSVSPYPDSRRPYGRVWIFRQLDETRAQRGTVYLTGATKNDFV